MNANFSHGNHFLAAAGYGPRRRRGSDAARPLFDFGAMKRTCPAMLAIVFEHLLALSMLRCKNSARTECWKIMTLK